MAESSLAAGQPGEEQRLPIDASATVAAGHPPAAVHHPAHLAHHFDDVEQQREAATLGMWAFLATEVLFLGALIGAYVVYRVSYPYEFAVAASHLNVLLATINTAVLLTSSFTMALAVHAAQTGSRRGLVLFLVLTMLFGAAFLGIKGLEYYLEYEEHLVPLLGFQFIFEGADPHKAELFFNFYFALTGLHALHMIIGLGVLTVMVVLAWRGHFSPDYYTPIEVSGLYWHLVDIVWVFLYPLLYLLHQRV
jgi:cytochrome c oxidase subunit 3